MNFIILPLFALTNADVALSGGSGNLLADPTLLGVFFGLLVGKPVGIMLFSFITVKAKIARLPEHVNWMHMLGAGILGGVGFTMAIFVANLAFEDAAMVTTAKVGILSASALAGVLGFLFLWLQASKDKKRGVAYITTNSEDVTRQTAGAEAARAGEQLLAEVDSPLLRAELEAARREQGVTELVVDLGEDGLRSDHPDARK